MDVYKYRKREEYLNTLPKLLLLHLSGKFEGKKGILEVVRFGASSTYGIDDRTVLEKSLTYYNNQPDTQAFWYSTSDVDKILEKNEPVQT